MQERGLAEEEERGISMPHRADARQTRTYFHERGQQ